MRQSSVGKGNGEFLAHVAEGVPADELRKRWKEGRYPNLHAGLAKWAIKHRGF